MSWRSMTITSSYVSSTNAEGVTLQGSLQTDKKDIICPSDLCVMPVENSSMRSMSEAHENVHFEKCYTCTYPKCDHVYMSAAKYQRHLKRHCEPQEPRTCSECDKSFEEKKFR